MNTVLRMRQQTKHWSGGQHGLTGIQYFSRVDFCCKTILR